MKNNNADLSSIVQSAISIESAAQRKEFLDRSSGGNRSLRGRLQMILDSLPESKDADARQKPHPNRSVIKSLSTSIPETPRVLLNTSDATQSPMVQPASTEIPNLGPDSRYQIQGEIARGGMGAILKGRDTDLGRSLAVKVLLEQHKDNELAIQRFIEEAQIGGQLQHPGIAPVFELGRFEDQRPFFTMKLVNGETLAWTLLSRRSPQQDRAKLLAIFHQVCQTMAYAHSRRVIHRDLKPANMMVGSFGEVQVMDWGLAKVLPKRGTTVEKRATPDPIKGQSLIQTVRSADGLTDGPDTQLGSAMGTPAYMPPEQAVGDVDHMDRRADVFGLGAILCEILTGEAPYVADTTHEIIRMAALAKLEPCHARLERCGADPDLIDLAKRCLSAEAADRPADAEVLAEELGDYLQSVERKLQQAKIESAEQAARFAEERKRRRVALALAASILLMIGLGGSAWMQAQADRQAQIVSATEQFDEAMGEANLHLGLAEDQNLAVQDAELSKAAINAGQAVRLSVEDGVDEERRAKAKQLLAEIQQREGDVKRQIERQTKDQRMQDRLELIRLGHADGANTINVEDERSNLDTEHTIEQYKTAFAKYGLDVETRDPTEVASVIKVSAIREVLIAAIDHWAKELSITTVGGSQGQGQPFTPDPELRASLLSIANAADESQWRKKLRSALAAEDFDNLSELVTDPETKSQSPALIAWLGATLRQAKRYDDAVSVLQPMQQQHPADFWITYELGKSLDLLENDEAIGFLRAALAIRPKSTVAAWSLVAALDNAGMSDDSEQLFQQMLDSSDMTSEEYAWLADGLYRRGRYAQCEAAIGKALVLNDRNAKAYQVQARVECQRQEYDNALKAAKQAVEFAPLDYWSYFRLGRAYENLYEPTQAEAAYRKAITLNPPRPTAHSNLAHVLRQLDRPEEAAQMYREARKIRPDYFPAIQGLRALLLQIRKTATVDQALAIDKEIAQLPRRGESLEMGIDELRKKLELNRRDLETRHELASKLRSLGHREEAIKEWETVIQYDPNHFSAHYELAKAVGAFGTGNRESSDRDRAIEYLRKTLELVPDDPKDPRMGLARWALATKLHRRALGDYEFPGGGQFGGRASVELLNQIRSDMTPQQVADLDDAIKHYRAYRKQLAERSSRRSASLALRTRDLLIAALKLKGEQGEAARLAKENRTQSAPTFSKEFQTLANKVRTLSQSGASNDVIFDLLRKALTQDWQKEERRYLRHSLAMALRKEKRYAEAAELYRANMEEFPDLPNPPIKLAQVLLDDGQVDDALKAIKKTSLQDTSVWNIYHRIGQSYVESGELDKAMTMLRQADIKNNIYLGFHRDIALIRYERGEVDEAIAEMRRALDGTYAAPRYQGELAWLLLLIRDEDGKLIHLDEAAKCAAIARRSATKNLSVPSMDNPRNASTFTALGMVHYRQGKWREALADLKLSRDHKYEGFDNLVFLALAHWQLGNREEAGKWYDQAAEYRSEHYLNRAEREFFEELSQVIGR